MQKVLRWIALACGAVLLLAAFPAGRVSAQAAEPIGPYVRKMVNNYKNYQDPSSDVIRESLEKVAQTDPTAGILWEKIMADWARCNEMEIPLDLLPDGLPEDDSMCIVVLGYQLNWDGSMRQELIDRLETALRSAQKYPNAYIAVTGGGTATGADITEAEAMAAWLMEKGIEEKRIIIEKDAMSTTYNAVNTYALLVKDYPSVKGIALVTSDYHVPWGAVLFQTVCNYTEVYGKTVIPVIACAANATDCRMNSMEYQASGICAITGITYK